ncbi:MAG TPA: DUF6030 family protein [Alphaproteobacteria bacterium]
MTVVFARSAAGASPVDLDRVEEPAALCHVLRPLGLDAGVTWRRSAAIPGAWSCSMPRATRDIGGETNERAERLEYAVLGSGSDRIDRIVVRLDINDRAGTKEGRALLASAANMVADALGIKLPPKIDALIATHMVAPRPDWRPSPEDPGRQVLHEERRGWIRVRFEAETSRVAALIVSFVNPNASGVWGQAPTVSRPRKKRNLASASVARPQLARVAMWLSRARLTIARIG